LIVELFGVYDYSGYSLDFDDVKNKKQDIPNSFIITEKLNENKIVNKEFLLVLNIIEQKTYIIIKAFIIHLRKLNMN